jgi:RNA polymerase sigma-70 factor (ECF subfamily)
VDDPAQRQEDHALAARLRAGDQGAFRELHAAHAPKLLRLLARVLRDAALAEEVLQETFLAVFQHAGEFRAESSLSSWLAAIAMRRAHNARRSRERRPASIGEGDEAQLLAGEPLEPALGERDLARRVLRLMDRLDAPKREALLLYAEGYTAGEIAEVTGEARGTILSRLSRARGELATLMASMKVDGGDR